jgi:hypothetical protein
MTSLSGEILTLLLLLLLLLGVDFSVLFKLFVDPDVRMLLEGFPKRVPPYELSLFV